MTNTELIELLRKTRGWVGHNLDCTNVCDECALAARIDAALAEHDAREANFRRERDDAVLAAIVARGG